VHVVGKLGETPADLGVYAGRTDGLTRRTLWDRARGAVHHSVVHNELADGSVERHMHAFEEGIYVLSGSLAVEVGGAREQLEADDYLWIEFGVPHAVSGTGAWIEVSAPLPGASLEDTVFTAGPGVSPEVPFRRGHFDVSQLPEPSGAILAGAGANVGGASVKLLINADFGASQFVLMTLRYVEGGLIKEHDHAFEEGFFFLEGEIEAELDGERFTLGPGDYCWSSVEGMHALTNRSSAPVRWLETQAPQPPTRHQFRYRVDWDRLVAGTA
jgi:mannose-6-phosphate isomerase-like protein (cupin superfamily)